MTLQNIRFIYRFHHTKIGLPILESPMKAHILGFPRIGAGRELKHALEACWNGTLTAAELIERSRRIRRERWAAQHRAGLDFVTVGDFPLYDQVLDATCLLGASPARFGPPVRTTDLQGYFAMARGGGGQPALELTKWFDTNYHYLVPELSADTKFAVDTSALLAEIAEARALGYAAKPVLIGPLTYLFLAKAAPDFDRLTLLPGLVAAYRQILSELGRAGADWVQVDEPALVLDLGAEWTEPLADIYESLGCAGPKILLATYFEGVAHLADALMKLPVAGLHLDLVRAPAQLESFLPRYPAEKVLSLGVVDGRNVWRTDLDAATLMLQAAHAAVGDRLWVSASCSLLHSPLDVDRETRLPPEIRPWLAFAGQKLTEVSLLKAIVGAEGSTGRDALERSRAARSSRAGSALTVNAAVRARMSEVGDDPASRRSPFAQRAALQRRALGLPALPTTTIGSFPQTAELRRARARAKSGELDVAEYEDGIRDAIRQIVRFQVDAGLDVLVHGEPERNDMVEYFGEHLAGIAITDAGWVQSYGSRCVKPPVIYGDVYRPGPITVDWIRFAQGLTDKPVKGMLTGPVTLLKWSFVRDDQPLEDTALQLALAISDEVADLERAGIRVIQVDEPALREGLPLKQAARREYLEWAVRAFRIAVSRVADETQIHTHMCYSEFAPILDAIVAMDADVLTIEHARSGLAALAYPNGLGPGVFDVHTPQTPSRAGIAGILRKALVEHGAERLWVNPDCGLKTRAWAEITPALRNMVDAAREVRAELAPGTREARSQAMKARPNV
jgi:5-methyltetrahydropteroyltriglutamate--homocysteine methyltransferase